MTNPSFPAPSESTPFLRRLLDETSDLIDSPAFTHVLTLLLDSSFSLLIDNKLATMAFKIPPISESTARVQEIVGGPEDQKCKVANTLAIFCRQAHSIGSGSTNEYLAAMEEVRDLEAFAAVVYSSNFEFEAPGAGATDYVSAGVNGAVGTTPDQQNSSDMSLPPSLTTTMPGTGTDVKVTPASLMKPVDPKDIPVPLVEDELEKAWENALAKEAEQRTQ
jgi:peroxin-3